MTGREKPGARQRNIDIDAEKRNALIHLRDRYVEARNLVSSHEPYRNLEWILGARRNPTQDPLALPPRTVELVALWLQDLVVQLDTRAPEQPASESEAARLAGGEARRAVAQKLRDATKRFLTAFRPSIPIGCESPA
jgi:hypothetical protein